MIQLTVLDSIEKDKCIQYTFYKNLIYIGSHSSCDFFINDSSLSKIHIFIEIVNSKLLIHLDKTVKSIHVDGKRTTAHKYINIGSKIQIGSTTFRIDSYLAESREDIKENLNKLTENIINNEPDLLKILQDLQEI